MLTKTEFLSLPELYKRLKKDTERVNNMRDRLYTPKGLDTRDKVQSSGGKSMLAEIVIDMQQKLDDRMADFNRMKVEAAAMIADKLDDDTALVIRLRYVECISWSEIQAILDCSPATLYRCRKTAIHVLFNE